MNCLVSESHFQDPRTFSARSQPPLFIQMVHEYVEETGDAEFARDHMRHLETEFAYWLREHAVTVEKDGNEYTMFR